MAHTVTIHLPSRSYPHYAFVTEAVEVEKQYVDIVGVDNGEYNIYRTIHAGIYGFTNKEARVSFIAMLNRSSETEVAFIGAPQAADIQDVNWATGPVERNDSPLNNP